MAFVYNCPCKNTRVCTSPCVTYSLSYVCKYISRLSSCFVPNTYIPRTLHSKQEDASSVRLAQNENQLPSADEWVQNNPVVDNVQDTKNSIDNPQDILNNNNDIVEADKSEVKRDIANEHGETYPPLSFKVTWY